MLVAEISTEMTSERYPSYTKWSLIENIVSPKLICIKIAQKPFDILNNTIFVFLSLYDEHPRSSKYIRESPRGYY